MTYLVMTQIATKTYPLETDLAPRAPRLRRNFRGPTMSKEIPVKMGEEDSNKFKNLGGPTGGSNLEGSLLVFIQVTHLSIKAFIIFFECATITPKFPCLSLAAVVLLFRCRVE